MEATKQGLTLIVFSGDMDKVLAAMNLASGALAMGMPARLFFTFWGTNILRQSRTSKGKHFLHKAFGAMLPVGPKKLSLSRYNFGGAGAGAMRYLMNKFGFMSAETILETNIELGAEIYVCTTSMEMMGIQQDELIQGVDLKYCGVAKFLEMARTSETTLFI